MKNYYDKIFLLVAFLVVAASCAYFFVGNSNMDSFNRKNKSLMAMGAQGETWDTKEVKIQVSKSKTWRYPDFQDDKGDWLFQVFTPPRIWEEKGTGNFITTPPKIERIIVEEEKVEAICDLYLADVTSGEYHLSLIGYMGSSTDPMFQLKDERQSANAIEFNAKKGVDLSYKDPDDLTGKTMIDLGLKIINFKRETVKRADNTIADVMTIEIEDSKLNKLIKLRLNEKTILEDERQVKLVSTIDDSKEWFVSKVGEEILYNNSAYIVKEISFSDSRVVLSQIPNSTNYLSSTVELTPRPILAPSVKTNEDDPYSDDDPYVYEEDPSDTESSL